MAPASDFLSPRIDSIARSSESPSMRAGNPAAWTAASIGPIAARSSRPDADRKIGRQHQAAADRLAVQPPRVARHRLDRMTERMAEIQQRPLTGLALVARDDAGLDLAGAGNGSRRGHPARRRAAPAGRAPPARSSSRSASKPCLRISASPAESSRAGSVFSVAVSLMTSLWLVKRADQVLAALVIDARLAADRRIDLCQQRRRHLHEADAAHEDRGGKTRDIADHAATQRDDEALAIRATIDQRIENRRHRRPVLVGLAVRQHDRHELAETARAPCAPVRHRGRSPSRW